MNFRTLGKSGLEVSALNQIEITGARKSEVEK